MGRHSLSYPPSKSCIINYPSTCHSSHLTCAETVEFRFSSTMDLSTYLENTSESLVFKSNIPEVTKSEPCILGIDEAGRGPVLGPMVYGICFCPVSMAEKLANLGFADSKTLKEEDRDGLLKVIEENNDFIGKLILWHFKRFMGINFRVQPG